MKQIRRHLTYANVMSSIAVFLMLGGATAFAATKIGANEIKANSIKTGKIVKEAVTAGKLKTGAVITGKLANAAVTNEKLADNAVTSTKIADNAVTTTKIANDAVTGDKVKESTLGAVPNAINAINAENLQRPEAFHEIGAVGEPPFQNGFVNFGGEYETGGFYLDRQCLVHLKGVIVGSENVAFTLPDGFRPPEKTFGVIQATNEEGNIQIAADGTVDLESQNSGSKNFGLSGFSFRVAGC